MRHRFDSVGIAVMHLGDQRKDAREAFLISLQFVRSNSDSGEVGDTKDVFLRN